MIVLLSVGFDSEFSPGLFYFDFFRFDLIFLSMLSSMVHATAKYFPLFENSILSAP